MYAQWAARDVGYTSGEFYTSYAVWDGKTYTGRIRTTWSRSYTATYSTISWTVYYTIDSGGWMRLGYVQLYHGTGTGGTLLFDRTSNVREQYAATLGSGSFTISHTGTTTLNFYSRGCIYAGTTYTCWGSGSWKIGN